MFFFFFDSHSHQLFFSLSPFQVLINQSSPFVLTFLQMAASQRRLACLQGGGQSVASLLFMFLFYFPVGLNFNDTPQKLLRYSAGLISGAVAHSPPELSGYRRFSHGALMYRQCKDVRRRFLTAGHCNMTPNVSS